MELEAQSEICAMLEYWNNEDYSSFESKRAEAGFLLNRYKSKITI